MTNWRLLETEIEAILRAEGFSLDQDSDSGDKVIKPTRTMPELNITLFARELAERIGYKPKTAKVTV